MSKLTKSKLYHLTAPNFQLPFYIDHNHRVTPAPAQNIPMLMWPDGHWCVPANIYMLELYEKGLSRKNRGGTLLAYATNISHLIRFCYANKHNFIDLTDNQFSFFIKTLQGERRSRAPEVQARDANSVIAVGRNCLDFLASVGHFYDDDGFIGPKGRIRAEQKEYEIRTEGMRKGRGRVIRKYWHHRSFPLPDPKNRRLPISTDNVYKLREAVLPASDSIYQRKRRYAMLKLLEITGGRRSEVAALTVDSVRQAAQMTDPMLKLPTFKRPGGREEYRFVPIAYHDVTSLIEFIDINRRRIIRLTCGPTNDDGFVLASETTGKGIQPNTITQELSILATVAGITEKVCAHMFRHRFITKLFVTLIEQHQFENEDDFRRALLDTETIKQKIQQWTGHTNVSSLDVYINLAFDEITNFGKTYSLVNARRASESFEATIHQMEEEMKGGAKSSEMTHRLKQLLNAYKADLDRAEADAGQIESSPTTKVLKISAGMSMKVDGLDLNSKVKP